jgi:excinuclease ABC subunit A
MPTTETRGQIAVRGARTHNLKNVDVTLPARSLIVMTGVSGSGSPLAFDTIYAEGSAAMSSRCRFTRGSSSADGEARRRQHRGHLPAIAIRQKNSIRNGDRRSARRPRSTITCAC